MSEQPVNKLSCLLCCEWLPAAEDPGAVYDAAEGVRDHRLHTIHEEGERAV